MEGNNAVAASGGPAGDSICGGAGAGSVGVPVPSVAAAGSDGLHTLSRYAGTHVDGDAGRCTGAAIRGAGDKVGGSSGGRHGDGTGVGARGPGVAAGTAGGERGAFVAVDVIVARNGYHGNGLDGEVQGVHLRAAVRIRVAVGVMT